MGLSPQQPATLPIRLRSIAAHHTGNRLAQQVVDRPGGATATEGEHRGSPGHERPEPRLRLEAGSRGGGRETLRGRLWPVEPRRRRSRPARGIVRTYVRKSIGRRSSPRRRRTSAKDPAGWASFDDFPGSRSSGNLDSAAIFDNPEVANAETDPGESVGLLTSEEGSCLVVQRERPEVIGPAVVGELDPGAASGDHADVAEVPALVVLDHRDLLLVVGPCRTLP